MSLGIALSLIGGIISMEESDGGIFSRFKWKFELFFWARKCINDTSEVLYKDCVADFVKEILRKYESHIFSEDDMEKICDGFLNKYPKGNLDKLQLKEMLKSFNEKRELFFSPGERSILGELKEWFKRTGEKLDGISEEHLNKEWDMIILKLNDINCGASDFGIYIVGKCHSCLEKVVMMFPNINFEKKEKYQKLFNQCCMESESVNPYEVVVNALSKNFEGYADRYKGSNGLYYSSEYVDVLKKGNVKPQASVNIDSIVDSIVADLKKGYIWENENALSEYVEYFFDVLTNDHIIKLAEPYIEIFIDNARQERSFYNSSVFKNKEIAKKIMDKCKNITNVKNSVVYPVLIKFFSSRKTSLIPLSEFKECMWRDFGRKLYELGVDKKDFLQIPI